VVAIDQSKSEDLIKLSNQYAITLTKIGKTGGDSLTINGCVIELNELRTAHTSTFPQLFG
jgi:phosphoribosylformylglycinamidine synthase